MRNELILGLSQAGTDCFVPDVVVRKNLTKYLLNDFDCSLINASSPSELATVPTSTLAVVAHPPNADGASEGRFFDQLDSLLQASRVGADSELQHRVVVAIGYVCHIAIACITLPNFKVPKEVGMRKKLSCLNKRDFEEPC
jgi:hypothetical protein